ncbi:hypothetical protein [Streptomyces sp. NPDC001389]|uniref:hypothetical protein n=1 Tax=Streptomyces sp. NPDC001389 TaxID=3364569 RepID=UPI00369EBBA2
MPRYRIQLRNWPHRSLILTDTPNPHCPDCQGEGGHNRDYGDYDTGEYAGTEWEPCPCWDENRHRVLLRLPRLSSRRRAADRSGYSDEPPF